MPDIRIVESPSAAKRLSARMKSIVDGVVHTSGYPFTPDYADYLKLIDLQVELEMIQNHIENYGVTIERLQMHLAILKEELRENS